MKWRSALVIIWTTALTGCNGDYDGAYIGGTGFLTAAVMYIDADTATVDTVNTVQRRVVETRQFTAKVRSKKLVLSADDNTFIYGLAVDEESLECLSDSCLGFGELGRNGMPRTWKPYKSSKD
jgi:hypothetical protein